MNAQQVNLYSPRITEIMKYADKARVERVMQATGCTADDARDYLVAEEGDEADAILSYRTDRLHYGAML